MHKFEEFEREVRSALEAEGIELLLPLVPDLFYSSSEEDNEGESVQSSVTSNNETTTTECMRIQYRDAYNIMATSPLNNHSNRKLHEKKGFCLTFCELDLRRLFLSLSNILMFVIRLTKNFKVNT